MLKIVFLLTFACFFTPLSSPNLDASNRYSYSEDKIFPHVVDFYGYTFVPCEGKMSTALYPDPIPPGIVSFTFTTSDIIILERARYTPSGIVDPPTDDKAYKLHIESVETTDEGFDFKLVNMRNRDLKGLLKVYKDNYSQVDMIRYRPSMADPEHTYFIKRTPPEEIEHDFRYYTHQEDFDAKTLDEFWGKTIYPFLFFANHSSLDFRKVTRIRKEDNLTVKFTEEVVVQNKKEKKIHHIIFSNEDGTPRKVLVKKLKEVEYQNVDTKRTILEVQVRDEAKDEDLIVYLHRGAKTWLKALELYDPKNARSLLYYEMRRGKSKV